MSSVTQVAKSAAKQIPTFVAILAALVLTATPWRIAGFALAVPALAGIAWRAYTSDFGRTMAAQLMLVFGALAAYRTEISAPADLSLIIAGAAVAALVAFQPLLELLVGSQQMAVANLPGYSGRRRIPIHPEALYGANIALVAVLAVCAAAGWSPWLVVLAAAVVAAGTLVVGEQALGARLRGNKVSTRFTAAIRRYEPAFAVYFSAPDDTEYHVHMWLPYLERIGRPFVLIVREPRAFKATRRHHVGPGRLLPARRRRRRMVTPSMRACFYVNNGAKNAHMVRFNQLTHIQLLHGDSDKASSFNPVTGDVRPDLRRRSGRHRPVRGQRCADPGREVRHRRPPAGRVGRGQPRPHPRRHRTRRCSTRRPGAASTPTPTTARSRSARTIVARVAAARRRR